MTRDGYTTADAVAALAIVGLTLAGVIAGMDVLGHGQRAAGARVSEAVASRNAEQELARLLGGVGPFRSDIAAFVGDASQFAFDCAGRVCGANLEANNLTVRAHDGKARRIQVPGANALRFAYVGSLSSGSAWPAAPPPPPAPQWQVLREVVLYDEAEMKPIAVADIWVEQAADCEFDSVIKDCREGTR